MRKSHGEHFSTAVPQKLDVVLNAANGSFVPILLKKSLMISGSSDSVAVCDSLWRRAMMGRLDHDQEQLFYRDMLRLAAIAPRTRSTS